MTTTRIALTKHHGLGNDFLVWLDGDVGRGPELARRWCDRRRGVGADGLLLALAEPDGASRWRMVLFNSDGSRAEMSGNGIRCFAQAIGRGEPGVFDIETDAGSRRVEVALSDIPSQIMASVDMGEVLAGRPSPNWPTVGSNPDRPVAHLDLGNPHTVVGVDDVTAFDLSAIGAQVPDINLEVIEPGPEPFAVTMRVHERGVGVTEACGTGACAAAWAAAQWGWLPANARDVIVHMDGGDAAIRLDTPTTGRVTLVGPATLVAVVEVEV